MDNLGIQIKAQAMLESKTSHTLRDLMESLQNDSGNIIIYNNIILGIRKHADGCLTSMNSVSV